MIETSTVTRLAISGIRRDGGTQPREQVSTAVATEYAEQMTLGAKFPPVVVFYDGKDRWLAGGFHRTYAAELTGATEIDADVRQGTQRDAILFSLQENAAHGLRRTNGDKRRAIARLFEDAEWRKWSDREIARRLQVDGKTVASMRPKDTAETRSERVFVNRHGSTSTMDVTKLANRPPADAPVAENDPAAASRGSRQLRIFLGEIRAGADVRSGSVVAEISFAEAQEHAVADARGEYADILSIEPTWRVTGPGPLFGSSAVAVENDSEDDGDVDAAVADDAVAPSTPRVFDFAIAQVRESVMQAIVTLASAPSPSDVADIWAEFVGHGVPAETIASAATWLRYFNSMFPEAEARRQQRVAAMMEKL